MFCKICGAEVQDGAAFCYACGSKILDKSKNEEFYTIGKAVEKEGLYIAQKDGKGKYGHCVLRFKPSNNNIELEFSSQTNNVPDKYHDAIIMAIQEAMTEGIDGKKLKGINCILINGSWNENNSDEESFKMAAQRAFIEAIKVAGLKKYSF